MTERVGAKHCGEPLRWAREAEQGWSYYECSKCLAVFRFRDEQPSSKGAAIGSGGWTNQMTFNAFFLKRGQGNDQ